MQPFGPILILFSLGLLLGNTGFVSSGGIFVVLCVVSFVLAALGVDQIDKQRGKVKFFTLRASDIVPGLAKALGYFVLLAAGMLLFHGPHRPEFEGQQRGMKIAKAQSDMRSLETALVTYRQECGVYPTSLANLTTPEAYIKTIPEFLDRTTCKPYRYFPAKEHLLIGSPYQPGKRAVEWDALLTTETLERFVTDRDYRATLTYDSTNGSASTGNIYRIGEPSPAVSSSWVYDSTLSDDGISLQKRKQ